MSSHFLQDVIDGQNRQELVECLLPHVRGEERHDGGDIGDKTEQAETGEQNTLAPKLVLFPGLRLT